MDSPRPAPGDAPLAPIEVDLARVMTVGIVVWLVALAATLVLLLTGTTGGIPAAVCATGAALGVLGWDWARRHRQPRETSDA